MSKLAIDRATLAKFLPNQPAIAAFERLISDVSGMPSTIEEAHALAANALATAAQALAMLAEVAAGLEQLATAPAQQNELPDDESAPRAHAGTLAAQNHDAVDITGGTAGLNAGAVSAPSFYLGGDKTTGLYRSAADVLAVAVAGTKLAELLAGSLRVTGNVEASQQLKSTVAPGTAPLSVLSTTKVVNLYADRAALADNATTANGLTSPSTYPAAATDLPTVIALANALRSAAISKGL